VRDHARQLVEKRLRKPFFEAAYAAGAERLAVNELQGAMQWIDERFHLIRCDDDELPSVDWVLERARAAVLRYGIRGLVIDPYNELDHRRPKTMSETEYVSQMLTKVKRFAQARGGRARVCVFAPFFLALIPAVAPALRGRRVVSLGAGPPAAVIPRPAPARAFLHLVPRLSTPPP
jgi:hypothetical protein